jgi:hypothetical protein
VDQPEDRVHDEGVEDERHRREHAREPVIGDHEDQDEEQPDRARDEGLDQEVGTQGGIDIVEPDLGEREWQGAEPQRVVQARALDLILRRRRADRDDRAALTDRAVDVGRRDDPAVEGDRTGPIDIRRREIAPDGAAFRQERERDADQVA